MGYGLHIERRGRRAGEARRISIKEWLAAVDATEGVRRFNAAKHSITNPGTGAVISWVARPGDADVFCGADGWVQVFSFFEGVAKFSARGVRLGDPTDPIWAAAVALARRLGAIIRGDDGQLVDLETGQESRP